MARHALLFLLVWLFTAAPTAAKNLEGRYGFGVSLQDFHTLPSLSLRYHSSQHFSYTFILGFNTLNSNNATIAGIKLLKNAHLEENLNFYIGVGLFIIADKASSNASVSSGIELDGLVGAEFFFSGLPNLAFMFETGIALRSVREVSFQTLGNGFFGAGIHYYF